MTAFSRHADTITPAPMNPAESRGRGTGIMFLSFFGSWWLALGARALDAPITAFAVIALCGATLFFAGWKQTARYPQAASDPTPADVARSRTFRYINVFQWSAIVATIVTLNAVRRPDWITPCIMLIVGLHFFPLARLFHKREHAIIGLGLCAVALIYPLVTAHGPLDASGPILAGLVLWSASLRWAIRGR